MALGEAVWADFWCNINSETSPIDLVWFRSDLTTPKIVENLSRSRVLSLNVMFFFNDMEGVCLALFLDALRAVMFEPGVDSYLT